MSNSDKPSIGTPQEFRTKKCFDLYMYAVSLAEQVNAYIDKGWLVIDEGAPLNRFVFYAMGSPCIAEKSDSGGTVVYAGWYGSVSDENGKVCFHGEYTKKSIRERFQQILIFDPAKAGKLQF